MNHRLHIEIYLSGSAFAPQDFGQCAEACRVLRRLIESMETHIGIPPHKTHDDKPPITLTDSQGEPCGFAYTTGKPAAPATDTADHPR